MPKRARATEQVIADKFIKAKLNGASNTQAALQAVPDITEASAKNIGMRLSTKVDVQAAIISTLEDHGVDYAKVLKPIAEGLEATKVIVMGKNTDDSFVDVTPDWSARLKAADMALKLMGGYNPPKPQDDPIKPLTEDERSSIQTKIDNGDVAALERIVFKSEPQGDINEAIK